MREPWERSSSWPGWRRGEGGLFPRLQEAPFLLDFRQLVQKFAERFSFKTFWEERNAFFERLFQFIDPVLLHEQVHFLHENSLFDFRKKPVLFQVAVHDGKRFIRILIRQNVDVFLPERIGPFQFLGMEQIVPVQFGENSGSVLRVQFSSSARAGL